MRSRDILEGQSCISTIWPWLFGALVLSGLREVSDQSTHLRRASLNAPAGRLKFPLFWQLRTILWHVQPWLGVERAAKPRAANFTACARVVVGRARAVRVEPRLSWPAFKNLPESGPTMLSIWLRLRDWFATLWVGFEGWREDRRRRRSRW